jgi:hypothetical protein
MTVPTLDEAAAIAACGPARPQAVLSLRLRRRTGGAIEASRPMAGGAFIDLYTNHGIGSSPNPSSGKATA